MLSRLLILALAATALLPAQRRTYDALTLDPPAGYQTREARDFLEFSRIDQQRKFYCQILVYRAQNSVGSALDDLESEWKATMLRSFKIRGKVDSREMPGPGGIANAVRIAETTDGNGNPAVTTLFVMRAPARYVGVAFNAPNADAMQTCMPDAAKLTASIQFNAATPAPSNPAPPAAAPAPVPGSLAGQWQRVIASQPPTRYNPITKMWEHDYAGALNQFRNTYRWIFQPNGEYLRELDAESFNRSERARVLERGRYRAANGILQLEPQSYQEGKGPRGQDPPLTSKPAPAPYSIRFTIGEHPQYRDSAGLQLEEKDGAWSTFKPQR